MGDDFDSDAEDRAWSHSETLILEISPSVRAKHQALTSQLTLELRNTL